MLFKVLGFLAGVIAFFGGLFGHPHSTGGTPPLSAPVTQAAASSTTTASESGTTPSAPTAAHYSAFSVTAIPLGDGKVSTGPEAGYVFSCTQSFKGGGASHTGDWIHGSTWNLTQKLAVEGKVYWNSATFSNVVSGAYRTLTGNGLPVGEPTGTFPIEASDPAYQIDRNPNAITAQSDSFTLPADPAFAQSASCVPMGAIGYALDGVAIFNALDASGRDAVAHEVQDLCDGHPESTGEYHYHGPSPCMPNATKPDTVVGYALDGFPITSMYDANGHYYTDADLDACHGMTSAYINEHGKTETGYHYVLTQEYPYTVGCFRGTPVRAHAGTSGAQSVQQASGAGGSTPPAAAVAACSSKQPGASCSFTAPKGTVSGFCKTTAGGSIACVPG